MCNMVWCLFCVALCDCEKNTLRTRENSIASRRHSEDPTTCWILCNTSMRIVFESIEAQHFLHNTQELAMELRRLLSEHCLYSVICNIVMYFHLGYIVVSIFECIGVLFCGVFWMKVIFVCVCEMYVILHCELGRIVLLGLTVHFL